MSYISDAPTGRKVLDATEARRLTNILNRLASNHDGEVLASANVATRFLRERNLGWGDVIALPQAVTRRLGLFGWLLASPKLTAWERSFVANLDSFEQLSRKQRDVLATIVAKAVP
jgi:hypothetical protein